MAALRERKKAESREHIASTAMELFLHRGFEAVTVAQVAEAADVSQKTVFNYFPAKEDLVFRGLEAFEQQLLDAVAARAPDEAPVTAFGRLMLEPRGLLAESDPAARRRLVAVNRMIAASPALLAREQRVFAEYTATLAEALRRESGAPGDAIEPWVTANALMGVHRALVDLARRRALEGVPTAELAQEIRGQAIRALALLEDGLE